MLHSCTGGCTNSIPVGGFEVDKQLVCACRYLSVAKNKRLRVFTVPKEHVDEVGGHGWLESASDMSSGVPNSWNLSSAEPVIALWEGLRQPAG